MAEYKSKILIIGSGPAGYTAGIYAARAGLSATIVSGPQPGGQLTITTDVENFPGFPTPVAGTQLMEDMRQQALKLGVEIVEDRITEVDFKRRPFECNSENHNLFVGDTVIIATGASARWLGLKSTEALSALLIQIRYCFSLTLSYILFTRHPPYCRCCLYQKPPLSYRQLPRLLYHCCLPHKQDLQM